MTDEQINQRIAKACGWTDFVVHPEFGLMGTPPNTPGLRTAVEFYIVDLNAMHEAEKMLAPRNWNNYSESWWNYSRNLACISDGRAIHATARQRAEAFLRTLGKWDDQSGERTEMEAQK